MRRLRIQIDRLQVNAPGMPPAMVSAALGGLAEELEARLARARLGDTIHGPLRLDELSLGQGPVPADASALRAAIAEGLVEHVRRMTSAEEEA